MLDESRKLSEIDAKGKGRLKLEHKVDRAKKAKIDVGPEDEMIPMDSLNESDILVLCKKLVKTDMIRAEIKATYGEGDSYKLYMQRYEHFNLAIENKCNFAMTISNLLVGLVNSGFPGSEEVASKTMPRIMTLRPD